MNGTPLDPNADPIQQFQGWLAEAEKTEPNDPNALCLATVGADGRPAARMVLLKAIDERGFVFYTNTESRKGLDLDAHAVAALCFHWKSLRRQVRVEGCVQVVDAAEADAYFDSRARDSRIGAWASQQSRPLQGRFELEKRVAQYVAKFGLGHIPRPPYWTGYRVVPDRIEFWRDRPFRLHDRLVYSRDVTDGVPQTPWTTQRLYP